LAWTGKAARRKFAVMADPDDREDIRTRAAEERAAKARAALEAMGTDYIIWTLGDLDKFQALLAELTELFERDPAAAAARWPELHAIAHNIKGQGTSFGYPLVTRIAASLSRITRQPRPVSIALLNLAGAHLEALRAVLLEGIKDETVEAGRARAEVLESTVKEMMGDE
jgi:Hpt domain